MPREPFPRKLRPVRMDVIETIRLSVAGVLLAAVAVGVLWAAPEIHAHWPTLRAWWIS